MPSLINTRESGALYARIVMALSAVLICGILTAGLWPFHAPRNNAYWLANENGLRFESYATAVSAEPFRLGSSAVDDACTLEIWLAPGVAHKGTILAFSDEVGSRVPLALRQVGNNLALERYLIDQHGRITRPWLTIENVFHDGPVFVTITSGKQGTLVYTDGILTKASSSFGLQRRDFTGLLILGTSSTHDSWTGKILGMAIQSRQLTEQQVLNDLHRWTSPSPSFSPPELTGSAPADALYMFNERVGNVVHNLRDPATDLMIPIRYSVLRRPFLQPPWEHFHDRWSAAHFWSYWQDAGVNVAGFLPVGFCFAAFFSSVARSSRPFLAAIVSGFLLSLTIEVLQAFLPTRNSGLTDVITNTAGTGLGVMLYCSSPVQSIWIAVVRGAISALGRGPKQDALGKGADPAIPA